MERRTTYALIVPIWDLSASTLTLLSGFTNEERLVIGMAVPILCPVG